MNEIAMSKFLPFKMPSSFWCRTRAAVLPGRRPSDSVVGRLLFSPLPGPERRRRRPRRRRRHPGVRISAPHSALLEVTAHSSQPATSYHGSNKQTQNANAGYNKKWESCVSKKQPFFRNAGRRTRANKKRP